ncbi:protealysin inhibitor emfourin [Methylobacterium sp. Leaf85]|uniref:protealysin inhibitor emfourin n=1 Tax=Methylobacterium sp. Leaf85 TaxID=1736241 RepID=UPI0006F729F2|nr:protealysin inhibitor emfourin [Methylobacterium sp. Leaf85]KQO42518.1 hypothetical protein ASF08_13040 [Methylobacterium sp. Leaf85]
MKVTYADKGGWAAQFNMRAPPAVLDVGALPRADREKLERLIQAAFACPLREEGIDRKAAGSYTITVEDESGWRTLSVADVEEENEPAAAALREWIKGYLSRR